MANSKPKKSSNPESMELIRNEVASYASSIGLSSSLPSSGFNDSDFRKTGTLKAPKTPKLLKDSSKPEDFPQKTQKRREQNQKPKPKVFESALDQNKGFDRFKNLPKLPLVKASVLGVWYVDAAELEAKVFGKEGKKKLEAKSVEEWKVVVARKREVAERLMAQYVQDYESPKGQSGDIKMLVTTAKAGTAADKVSAFSVMVGENPIANLRSLDALLGMVASKVGKRHALTGFEALKELFVSSLLPDRKLKTLLQQPLNHLPETKDGYSLLLLWYWEECLKQRYERFVVALEEASRDMLPILKDKATKTMYALLRGKPEQERRLLSALVNKLGDPGAKGASYADFHLSNLLTDHPNMKSSSVQAVVIDEVDAFLFRPHLGLRAKYHAVNFLSQIRLSNRGDGPKVAKRLLDVYFALFKVLISEAGGDQKIDKSSKAGGKTSSSFKNNKAKDAMESHVEMDSRLLSVLLTGVNRAFPYVSSIEADDIIEVQTPMLFQLAEMFIGLLLRAMKNDVNLKRVAAFAKRILQMALQQPPQYACGCLFLLSEVLRARPPLWNTVLQNESVDDELEHFEDIVEETENEPSTVKETEDKGNTVLEKRESTRELINISENMKSDGDSSEDEDDSPASDLESDASDEGEDLLIENDLENLQESKTFSDHNGNQSQVSVTKPRLPGGYDPRHREPSYCNADRVSWWELTVLASHVHPSVATMARTILSGANIVYNGNPLNDLSLSAFLDKLMEKKPKASTWHGGSTIEPAKKLDMNHHLIGAEILSLAEMDVPPEDLVFHKFYANKVTSSKKPKKKKKKGAEDEAAEEFLDADGSNGSDDEEVEVDGGDESDNEEIENMLDTADPSLESNSDYDYDDLDQVADMAEGEDDEDLVGNDNNGENSEDDIDFGDASDDDGNQLNSKKRKQRKSGGKTGKSPFASLEDYEHLLNEETPADKKPKSRKRSTEKKSKSRKKRKSTS
uniref:CCAAT-binding factor domain-containing protein n=1 Tax=Vitis vinifera TaxID=29760 RepID=A5BUU5_VITVI|nr:hypothetical protein VITISV_015796 [Vitis vinifera]